MLPKVGSHSAVQIASGSGSGPTEEGRTDRKKTLSDVVGETTSRSHGLVSFVRMPLICRTVANGAVNYGSRLLPEVPLPFHRVKVRSN